MNSRRFFPHTILLLTGILVLPIFSAGAENSTGPNQAVDYARDIAPLFARHCNSCHGKYRAENNFRLDSATFLQEDLDSPFPILGDTLEHNEVHRRITSDDPMYRMPAEGSPLSADEIDVIRRWIVQGMPLGEVDQAVDNQTDRDFYTLGGLYEFLRSDPRWMNLILLLLATNAVILGVERQKRRARKGGVSEPVHAPLLRVGAIHYLFVWTLFAIPAGYVYHDIVMTRERESLEELKALVQENQSFFPATSVEAQYGNPPVPVRMDHPNAVQRTYYRGNDERDPRLFNGGYYRTSTLLVRIVHEDGVPLEIGNEIRPDEAFVEFAFDRAPYTAAVLYSDFAISLWNHMSSHYPWSEVANDPDRSIVEVVESGCRWRMRYPLNVDEDSDGRIQGLVYTYYRDKPHYGIVYDLKIENGKLLEGSDIWLGNLYVLPNLLPPVPDGFLTQREWVDFRPIPVIPEPQTVTDPDLLGITEHLGGKTLSE